MSGVQHQITLSDSYQVLLKYDFRESAKILCLTCQLETLYFIMAGIQKHLQQVYDRIILKCPTLTLGHDFELNDDIL